MHVLGQLAWDHKNSAQMILVEAQQKHEIGFRMLCFAGAIERKLIASFSLFEIVQTRTLNLDATRSYLEIV